MQNPEKSNTIWTRQLRLWDPLLTRQEFSVITYWKAITHPRFLVFACLTMVLFFATDPSGNRPYVALWESAAIWPMAFVMYMALYSAALLIQSALTAHIPTLRVPTSFLGFITLFPTVYFSEAVLLRYMSDGTYPEQLEGRYLFYFLSVQVSEAVFFRFIYPGLRNEVVDTDEQDESAQSDTRHVIIGGERIRLGAIKLIEAREHHVQVTLEDSQRRLRARLGDIVAQTTSADGVQTHRSWWVARHAAKELSHENGRPVLRLTCDLHIPVARTRVGEVRTWAQTHLVSETSAKSAAE